jgi:tetratricopeptide (TPR) repeat protein
MRHGQILTSLGRNDEALPIVRDALAIFEAAFGENDLHVAVALNAVGQVLAARGEHAEAQPAFVRSLAIFRAVNGDDHGDTRAALELVVAGYERLGRPEKAAEIRADFKRRASH